MNQSYGSWMLTGGAPDRLNEDVRKMDHLRAVRERRSEQAAVRGAERHDAIVQAISSLRARIAGEPTQITPDCCPA
jgi:hypothetical protein